MLLKAFHKTLKLNIYTKVSLITTSPNKGQYIKNKPKIYYSTPKM